MKHDFTVLSYKRIRMALGLTQGQMAARLGVKQSFYSKLENGLQNGEPYKPAIINMLNEWKTKRIADLKKEIDYIKNI
jgi:transcriptional regulator with XRE-family HTH domain